jgi:hypothetical protein
MSSKTIASAKPKAEPFFERHAWKVLLFFGLFMSLIGLADILVGGSFYQEAEGTSLGLRRSAGGRDLWGHYWDSDSQAARATRV